MSRKKVLDTRGLLVSMSEKCLTRKTCCVCASCNVCNDDEETRRRKGPLSHIVEVGGTVMP